jgi:hypothetical protein
LADANTIEDAKPMKPIYVKPAMDTANPERAGKPMIVRDPDRAFAPLPAEGMHVNPTDYWIKMLRDGSVIQCAPPAAGGAVNVGPSAAASNARPRGKAQQH